MTDQPLDIGVPFPGVVEPSRGTMAGLATISARAERLGYPDFRILGTGSRTWKNAMWIYNVLDGFALTVNPKRLVIVHGACEDGGDHWFDMWADEHEHLGVRKEPHPARWDEPCGPRCQGRNHRRPYKAQPGSWCPAAGIFRNDEMVALGADVCLAFIRDESNGSTHCADAAERAEIPTLRWRWGQKFTRNRKARDENGG